MKMTRSRATMEIGLYSMLGLLVFRNVVGITTRCRWNQSHIPLQKDVNLDSGKYFISLL